jgi:glycosyltransferase involved in cell wall biosynthesis
MFKFLKYIQPLWYYRSDVFYSNPALFDHLLKSNIISIHIDKRYSTEEAQQMDVAFQALQLGFIPQENITQVEGVKFKTIENRIDNYLFVSKYFAKNKLVYVYFIRLLTLNNPIKELFAFLKFFRNKRDDLSANPVDYNDFDSYDSTLVKENPLVSIVIPTLNRYEYLKDVLHDLEAQDYQNFEVIICDQSENVPQNFYEGWKLNIQLIQQEEKALWLARNRSIQMSNGEYILLFDDDSRVEPNWIRNHLKCLDYFKVKISAGVTHTLVGHGLGKKETYFHLSDVFDTGNSLVHKDVFKKIGLFDRQFEKMRMGDGEFGLRSILGGYLVVSNPFALRIHLKVETGGLRQMGSWDALRPKSLFAPRPVPSVLYLARKYFGNESSMFYLIQNIPFSFIPYQFKKSKILKVLFMFLLPLLFPLMFVVVMKSWRKSTEMLKIGDKIGILGV